MKKAGLIGLFVMIVLGLIVVLISFASGYMFCSDGNSEDDVWGDYWNCLDGCYNAQIPMGLHNKSLYDDCGDICYNRFVEDNRTSIQRW